MIQPTRVEALNEKSPRTGGKYVLYFMQQAMRTRFNHALEYAVDRANELGLPVVVCFGLMDDYPEANERHYLFLLQGLRDVRGESEIAWHQVRRPPRLAGEGRHLFRKGRGDCRLRSRLPAAPESLA
ncbi:MAG: hypothetical protein QM754_04690 [Tepidisphaeraceae bacterium]